MAKRELIVRIYGLDEHVVTDLLEELEEAVTAAWEVFPRENGIMMTTTTPPDTSTEKS